VPSGWASGLHITMQHGLRIFELKELETYELLPMETQRDTNVSPLLMLQLTFARFRLPEEEWRSPLFCSPVWFSFISSRLLSHFQVSARTQALSQ
jgi:hypothetical protein